MWRILVSSVDTMHGLHLDVVVEADLEDVVRIAWDRIASLALVQVEALDAEAKGREAVS